VYCPDLRLLRIEKYINERVIIGVLKRDLGDLNLVQNLAKKHYNLARNM
jgi:hypothetical protein